MSRDKTIPLAWLHILLTRIAPRDTPGRIVHLELGGETGKNPDIQALFIKHGYILEPTGPAHHPRMARLNDLTKQLATLSALCFAVRISLPNSGNTRFIFSCAFTMFSPMGRTLSRLIKRSPSVCQIYHASARLVVASMPCPLSAVKERSLRTMSYVENSSAMAVR
jgi:hypothetical protein